MSVYTFRYLREATKPESAALKLCVCVCVYSAGGLQVTEAERSNIVYDSLPRRFILGKFKLCRGSAFDLDPASTGSWISV